MYTLKNILLILIVTITFFTFRIVSVIADK